MIKRKGFKKKVESLGIEKIIIVIMKRIINEVILKKDKRFINGVEVIDEVNGKNNIKNN